MKTASAVSQIFFLFLLLFEAGCQLAPTAGGFSSKGDRGFDLSIYNRYAPVKIDIMPLTEFTDIGISKGGPKIKVYVSLSDSFGCQIKTPGVFRFELYEYVQRSGEPRGRRINIWPDIDLTGEVENNKYWRDFLRAYEFDLGFRPAANQNYLLQVTCLCANGRRLSGEFVLKGAE